MIKGFKKIRRILFLAIFFVIGLNLLFVVESLVYASTREQFFQCLPPISEEAKTNYIEVLGEKLNHQLDQIDQVLAEKNLSSINEQSNVLLIKDYLQRALCYRDTDGMLLYFEDFKPFLLKSKISKDYKSLLNQALELIDKAEQEKINKILKDLELPLE